VSAEDVTFQANVRPTLHVSEAHGAIRVDGDLNDPGWQEAAHAANFSEVNPGDRTKPPVDTDVLVTYDDSYFYVAFIAKDNPSSIRTTLRDRNQAYSDDYVGFLLDTYGDAAWAYEVFVNPVGVQGDLLWTPNSEDERFDMVYSSSASITRDGYQVEIAIPFNSLRFPAVAEQAWRITFWRNHPRASRGQYSWAAISRDEPCFPCQFGTLTGIAHVKPAAGLEILPDVTASQSASLRDPSDLRSGLHNESLQADAGVYMRYVIASNLTAEAAINPDFSQVESDADQIDVNTTFALFFPERRPFFQEGSDLLSMWINAVYTRSVNDPSAAARVTTRRNRTSIAYIGARDEHSPIIIPLEERSGVLLDGASTTNIARVKQTFLTNSYIGGLVTDRRISGGGSGTVFGVDGVVQFLRNYRIEGQLLGSHTEEPNDTLLTAGIAARQRTFDRGAHTTAFDGETFGGYATYLSLERDARVWRFDFDYWATSPAFRADNGFVTQNDNRRASLWSGLSFRHDKGFVEQWFPNCSVARIWNFAGTGKDRWARPELYVQLRGQTSVSLAYLWSHERFREIEFPDIRRFETEVNSKFSEPVQLGFYLSTGRSIARNLAPPVLGRGTTLSAWGTIKPLTRLVIEPTFDYAFLTRPDDGSTIFSGYILRARTQYQFTRALFARLITQYNDFAHAIEVDPLVTYKVNPFTAAYIGSTHEYFDTTFEEEGANYVNTSRQVFAKVQYLFRI
jgi:hypothetical protein